jgi:HSP20 family protein
MDERSTWDPFRDLRRLQREMEHLFPRPAALRWPLTSEYPRVNVTRGENEITVDALCPGVERESLNITVVGDGVTIRGERKPEPNVREDQYHRRERPAGSFTRTIRLGERLDPDRAQANYSHGILHLQLARAPEAMPKQIPIQN